MTPVLFVSHSSRDTDFAKDIVHRIDATGACKSILDALHLEQGDAWKPQLFQWMARCHAALILLTEDALASNWVLQEATVLRARKALEPGFRVFIVVAPDLKQTCAERWKLFEPLGLDEIQGLRTLDADAIAATVSAALQKRVQSQRKTLFDRLHARVADSLGELGTKPNTLAELADHLALDEAEWIAITGSQQVVCDLLSRRLCRGDLGGYAELRDLFAVISPVGHDELREMLHLLGAYWVVPAAAALFPAASEGPPPRLLVMRANSADFLAQRHIERIYGPYGKRPLVLRLCGGNETFADLQAQLMRALRADVLYDEDLSDEDVLDALDDLEARRLADVGTALESRVSPRTFVIVQGLMLEKLALELARAFPTLVFVVTVKEAELFEREWRHCRRVQPVLERHDEIGRRGEFGRAEALIK